MKKLLQIILTTWVTMMSLSCEYNDDWIKDQFQNHEERIVALETLCAQMNTNITSMQTIIYALQKNDYVTGIAPIEEGGKEIGYTITFSKSGSVTIYHGQSGADGWMPVIGVKRILTGNITEPLMGSGCLMSPETRFRPRARMEKTGRTERMAQTESPARMVRMESRALMEQTESPVQKVQTVPPAKMEPTAIRSSHRWIHLTPHT